MTSGKTQKTILSDFDDDFKEFETPSQKILRELKEKDTEEDNKSNDEFDDEEFDLLANDDENETNENTNIKNGKLVSNTCSAWISNINELIKEYEDYINNGNLSTYIKDRIKNFKKYNENITDEEIKQKLEYQYNNLKDFDFKDIENQPIFTINKNGLAARHQITNCYCSLIEVEEYYNIKNEYILERVICDYVRPYFDLDFKQANVDDIAKTLSFIDYLIKQFKINNPNLKTLFIAEYKPNSFTNTEDEETIIDNLKLNGMLVFKNEVEGFNKSLSIHGYVKGVCFDAGEIKGYIKDNLKEFKEETGKDTPGFDLSVYNDNKGKQQMFRAPYSGKPGINGNNPRPANPEILKYMKDEEQRKNIIYNCVICADTGDYVIRYESETENENVNNTKQKTKVSGSNVSDTKPRRETESIFRYLTIDGKFTDAKAYFEEANHFVFGQKICYLVQGLPLTEKEFEKEILLLKPNLNIDKFNIKFDYTRNFKEGYDKLCVIRANLMKEIKKINKTKEDKRTQKQQEMLESYEKVYFKINDYIEKYEKQNFIEHEFYDFKGLTNANGEEVNKNEKIVYNCFKTENDEAVYYLRNGKIASYKCKEALRRAFKMSGECVNKVFDKLATFESVNEFVVMRLQKRYDDLPDNEKSVDDLIKMIKESFTNEDDFKYYLSWLAYKVRYKTTNDRSIVCQSEDGPGQDSLKTFITQKLAPFIEVKTADVRNLNKNLNGSYLTGHLTVIEELPPRIKDTGDFISVLKTYSKNKTFLIEEKREKPREIENRTDFIINTNYNVAYLFYNKADANPLSKRIRILTRKSIDTKKWCKTLDKYGRDDIDDFNGFKFYKYLYNNEELIKYFVKHRLDKSETEKLYISAATTDTNDKIETNYDENEFIEWFKKKFINNHKRLKLGNFVDYLKDKEIFKGIKQATLKQQLITSKCMHVENGYNILTDDEIKNVYKKYFVYEEREAKKVDNVEEDE